MKMTIRRRFLATGLAAGLVFGAQAASADAVYFAPSGMLPPPGDYMTSVAPGASLTLDILGVFDEPLYGGTMSLGFDAAVLQIDGVTVDPSVWDFSNSGGSETSAGVWEGIAFDVFFQPPQGGSATPFVLATVDVTALALGMGSLTVTDGFFAGFEPPEFTPTLHSASVTVVPVPPAIVLALSGLAGLVAFGRRQGGVEQG